MNVNFFLLFTSNLFYRSYRHCLYKLTHILDNIPPIKAISCRRFYVCCRLYESSMKYQHRHNYHTQLFVVTRAAGNVLHSFNGEWHKRWPRVHIMHIIMWWPSRILQGNLMFWGGVDANALEICGWYSTATKSPKSGNVRFMRATFD